MLESKVKVQPVVRPSFLIPDAAPGPKLTAACVLSKKLVGDAVGEFVGDAVGGSKMIK